MSAQHPLMHILTLLICVLIAFSITSMAPASPALTLLLSIGFDKVYISLVANSVYHWLRCSWVHHILSCILQHCRCASPLHSVSHQWHLLHLPSLCCYLLGLTRFIFHCLWFLFTIHCDIHKCTTPPFTYASVVDMCPHCIQYHTNGSCFTCSHFVVGCGVWQGPYFADCVFCLPLTVMFHSAPHPFSHTPALLMCVLIAFNITSMAPASPALTSLSAVGFDKVHIPLVVYSVYRSMWCSWVHHIPIYIRQRC